MKIRLSLLTVLGIVYLTLYALCAWGQQEQALSPVVATSVATPVPVVPKPSTLPERLPIGNPKIVREWAVTNTAFTRTMNIILTYTNVNGVKVRRTRPGSSEGIGFGSYKDFVAYVGSNCLQTLENCKSEIDPRSDVQLEVPVGYSRATAAFTIKTNIGKINTITENSFKNLQPSRIWVSVPVPGLEKFEITTDEFDDLYGFYWYTWSNGISEAPWIRYGFATELAIKDLIYLDERFIFATNKIRFKITAKGVSAVYSQNGERISNVRAVIIGNKVSVQLPAGANFEDYDSVSLQSSVNGTDWTQKLNFTSKNTWVELGSAPLELFRIQAVLKSQFR